MRTFYRTVVTLGLAGTLAAATGTAAHASTATAPTETTHAEAASTLADYHGETIDLSQDWEGAQVCVQQEEGADVEFQCYDDDAEAATAEGYADVGTAALRDCLIATFCVWDGTSFTGKRLQFQRAGTYNMADYSFRDKISSFHNDRNSGFTFVDFRSGIIADRKIDYQRKTTVANLGSVGYPGGGSWNNKVDRIIVK